MNSNELLCADMQQKPRFALSRIIATTAGAGIVGASAFAVIQAGHQDIAHAVLTGALSAGVLVGASVIGPAWRSRRFGLSVIIVAALMAGELFNMVATADRVIAERETAQAAIRSQAAAHDYAIEAQSKAQTAYDDARKATLVQAALPGCKTVCASMLASAEAGAKADLDKGRDLATANPAPQISGSALADRIGWPAWALDLGIAALLSVAANGLGAALFAFGMHAGSHQTDPSNPRRPDGGQIVRLTPRPASPVQLLAKAPKTALHTADATPVQLPPSSRTPAGPGQYGPSSAARERVLALLAGSDGTVTGSQRRLAKAAGCSRVRFNEIVAGLQTAGIIKVRTGTTGTALALA